jgi:phospholipid transport system substrate-binding protein
LHVDFTRRSLAAAALFSAAMAPGVALADVSAEQFVARQGNAALATLSNRTLNPSARQTQFRTLFLQLADLQAISSYVLGPNGARRIRSEPALNADWTAAFVDYCVAVYEDQLDQFRGNEMKVVKSTDRVPGRDVIVETQIVPRGRTQPMTVEWRLLKRGTDWKVVDASLVIEDSRIWLAQQQRTEFQTVLGTRADVPALIQRIRQQTATMRQRIASKSGRG